MRLRSDQLYAIISDDLRSLVGMSKRDARKTGKDQMATFTNEDREAILRTVELYAQAVIDERDAFRAVALARQQNRRAS